MGQSLEPGEPLDLAPRNLSLAECAALVSQWLADRARSG